MSSLGDRGYRRYTKELKGRPYRMGRIIANNLRMMIKMKRVYLVILLAFFFLFFTVLEIALTQPIEDAQEEFLSYKGPGSFFEIIPAGTGDLETEVGFGEKATLSYIVTNTGNVSATPFFLFFAPNVLWDFALDQPLQDLEPGRLSTIDVHISVPDDLRNFSLLDPAPLSTAIMDSGLRGLFPDPVWEGLMSEEGKTVLDALEEYISDPFSLYTDSIMFERNYARMVMLYVIPDSILDQLLTGNISERILDPSICSLTSLLQVDIGEEGLYEHSSTRPSSGLEDAMEVMIDDNSSSPILASMYSRDEKEFIIEVKNLESYPIEVEVEALLMPIADMEWWVEVYPMRDPREEPGSMIGPGESISFILLMSSGFVHAEIPYNIVILVTDTSQSEYWNSEATQIVVQIEGEHPAKGLESEYFETMWGGDLNYMRFLSLILLTAVAGSTLISKDLKNNTLALYFSRPITWLDYLVGKWLSLFILLSTISMVPAFILFGTEMAFMNEGLVYMLSRSWLVLSAVLCYVMALSVFTSIALALSSLSKRWIVAGVGIFSFFLITPIISEMLVAIFGSAHLKLINIYLVMRYAFKPMFGLGYDADSIGFSYALPALVMLLIISICWTVLVLRFRGREVAK